MTGQNIANGGVQYVPQIAVQYVYLDFDGELTSYNGEILTVENVEVNDSALTAERIKNILAELNTKYASQNVIFVSEKPAVAEYSTIYVGKTEAFAPYGNFAGVAETIDKGNKISTDKAFVMLDSTASNEAIISTIAHETDHLLGTLDHGGEGLAAYADHYIDPGETSTGIVLNYEDYMVIYSGGIANNTTVNSGGEMYISSGGVAIDVIENGGYVSVEDGAVVNFIANSFSGVTLDNWMTLHSGTTANKTTVNSWGRLYISSGGVANSTTVNECGDMTISSGGVANSTTVNSWGWMTISSGGVANSTTVNSYGFMYIASGGTATNIIAESGAILDISVASNTYIQGKYAGSAFEMKDARIDGYTINEGGYMSIDSGGVANSTTINHGSMRISSGGVANSTTINHGSMTISSGGAASNTTVKGWGGMCIDSGGTANRTIVNSYGSMSIASGGTATNIIAKTAAWIGITVASNTYIQGTYAGSAFEMKDARIDGYTVNNLCEMLICSGGTANSTTVKLGGLMSITSGGTATNIIAKSDTYIKIAVASNTYIQGTYAGSAFEMKDAKIAGYTINSFGAMTICAGGVATNTIIKDYSSMYIESDGVANSTTVKSDGCIYISSGGVHRGSLQIAEGAVVSAYSGATIDFTVAGRSPQDGYLINNLNRIEWRLNPYYDDFPNYTITVSTDLASGSYKLAQGAENFSGSISIGDGTTTYGSITVNGDAFAYNNTKYVLTQSNGNLLLDIDNMPTPSVFIYSSGTLTDSGIEFANITLASGGNDSMHISRGGVANSTTINRGDMYIFDGGEANSTTMNDGYMFISSGGEANETTVNSDGIMFIYRGEANETTVNSDGDMSISSGGVANNTTVNSFGKMYIHYGGTANNTTVNSDGIMYIYRGGEANSTIVNSLGSMRIISGGIANNTTVNSGGSMYISSGGVHRGSLQIADGAEVSAYSGAIIDFTVADRSVEDDYLINDLSRISGSPTYTITVAENQDDGTYRLAQGAENFTGAISIGDGTTNFGSITVNGEDLFYENTIYSLDETSGNLTLTIENLQPELYGTENGVSWKNISGKTFVVEYINRFSGKIFQIKTEREAVDTFGMPSGNYQWRVKADNNISFVNGDVFTAQKENNPQEFISDADGNMDVFFAKGEAKWYSGYNAVHCELGEEVSLTDKNRIADVFAGSEDANILVMTDDANGDALFVDDVFTALGEKARLSQIDEIRAGAGDDVVDMTSRRFTYIGDDVKIYGGAGNDTIWASNGNNTLFGDAGNDRIVGGAGNDTIIGGIGDDSLHGGGGDDVFCFGDNWGTDTIEQLSGGSVTLWFENDNGTWNSETLTYSDGTNSVTVSGVTNIKLQFGADASLPAGCFDDAASEKIFEDKGKGMLA